MEINAKELRLGNYIDFIVSNDQVTAHCTNGTITDISKKDVCINEIRIPLNLLKPIPLTEEWLIKFGFNKMKHTNNKDFPDYILNKIIIGKTIHGFYRLMSDIPTLIEIKYVHQLQNLYFALTGEELKLN